MPITEVLFTQRLPPFRPDRQREIRPLWRLAADTGKHRLKDRAVLADQRRVVADAQLLRRPWRWRRLKQMRLARDGARLRVQRRRLEYQIESARDQIVKEI